jgi:16S rRNA (cytosine1402-N4)-methyltransferase
MRKEGRMKTTADLVAAVEAAVPPRLREKRIHPATRTFQAIRIQINHELEELQTSIEEIADCLGTSGRMVTLSYHSGEDGAAKRAFRNLQKRGEFQVLTKTPLRPTALEISRNPSSRSAKLRAIERTNKPETTI